MEAIEKIEKIEKIENIEKKPDAPRKMKKWKSEEEEDYNLSYLYESDIPFMPNNKDWKLEAEFEEIRRNTKEKRRNREENIKEIQHDWENIRRRKEDDHIDLLGDLPYTNGKKPEISFWRIKLVNPKRTPMQTEYWTNKGTTYNFDKSASWNFMDSNFRRENYPGYWSYKGEIEAALKKNEINIKNWSYQKQFEATQNNLTQPKQFSVQNNLTQPKQFSVQNNLTQPKQFSVQKKHKDLNYQIIYLKLLNRLQKLKFTIKKLLSIKGFNI